ncbi:hypothetical protein OHQ89_16140 [Streptomyces canus]|uniref:hypothetical protein n=1 Tax=Streptomyces canus TaxID=58343 RepID=UPI0030DFC4B5
MSEQWEPDQLERYKQIIDRDIDVLLRSTSTEYNFLELRDKVGNIKVTVQRLQENYDFWTQLPKVTREQTNDVLNEFAALYGRLEQFDPKQNNAWELRNGLVEEFDNRYMGFYEVISLRLNGYLGERAYSQELSGKFGQEAQKELTEVKKIKREIEQIQAKVHDASTIAGDVAATAQSQSFRVQSERHLASARRWLVASAVFTTVTFFVGLWIIDELIKKNLFKNFEATAFKLAILAFAYYVLRFMTRNYSAHWHLHIVNKHRENVLKSMDAFRESAHDQTTKDSILLAAVGAAYAQQETGFITTKEGAGGEGNDLLDVVKMAANKIK